ncbi:serine/threonine-protein kinase fused [Onthophagus taurus]|uniref:serine/threonine-protein kinase fused n=1 Tax=Onthophagus taurus TaxID=166361 RepID=UPI0039BDE589
MDKYDVIGLLGEGSFGRVYKAKVISTDNFVALKVISKRGRSNKELKGFRRECEIQRHLHHPNIIQMLDSFETENEIVVITEFAHKELNLILGKAGYLPEDKVQKIVWDLLSALYYLHSHRVLHRDLKPQNILLDVNDTAKLCDFGFARNMSTGTHVLTSIKGTPLYMAPELIEEQPYDHNADLWSLGCIIYELLVGAPPFCTASILHLIRLIKHEQVQWPTFISESSISFLKGLLQKNPNDRLSWPEILNHPFVEGHILIMEDAPTMPLTRPLSAHTLQAKEQQRIERFNQKTAQKEIYGKTTERIPSRESKVSNSSFKSCGDKKTSFKSTEQKDSTSKLNSTEKIATKESNKSLKMNKSDLKKDVDDLCAMLLSNNLENDSSNLQSQSKITNLNINEDVKPIENEEWLVFLQRTILDVLNEDLTSLTQTNLTDIIVSPLRNANSNSKVIKLVANVFSLPFVLKNISDNNLETILKVYLEVKLIPNLLYSSKLLLKNYPNSMINSSNDSASTPIEKLPEIILNLTENDLQALEDIFCLICYLIHSNDKFLHQFCDSIVVFNVYNLTRQLLTLTKKKIRIVNDLLAILTQVLRKTPENYELIQKIFEPEEEESLDIVRMLRDSNGLLRERVCRFLSCLAQYDNKTLENVWNEEIKDTVEALVYDSMENVRNAAETCIEHVKCLNFYTKTLTE